MYRFSLQTVLNHRKHKEEALQKELSAKNAQVLTAREELARLQSLKMDNLSALQQKQRDGASVSDIVLYDGYIRQISENLRDQSHRITKLMREFSEKRRELIEAVKQRKILDRLKEKEWAAYKRRLERKEQILMNEIAVSGFNRKKALHKLPS